MSTHWRSDVVVDHVTRWILLEQNLDFFHLSGCRTEGDDGDGDDGKNACNFTYEYAPVWGPKAIFGNMTVKEISGKTYLLLLLHLLLLSSISSSSFSSSPSSHRSRCFSTACGCRLLIIATTLVLAIYIPHFALLMGFVGSFTGKTTER